MSSQDAELARAYADVAKAEEHASLLENQLKVLEENLDLFLTEHNQEVQPSPAKMSSDKDPPANEPSTPPKNMPPGEGTKS